MEKNKKPEQQPNSVEHRFVASDFEVKKAEGQPDTLRGYALRFGSVYPVGWFTEEVHRDAFSKTNMDDIRILLNHDANLILGRTKAGTAKVGVDDTGLWYEFQLPNSPNGENVREAIRRGDITQSSWGFRLRRDDVGRNTGDKWEMRNGKEHRILMDVAEVLDASPVTFPANPDTTVAKRSLEAYQEEQRKEETPAVDMAGVYEKLNRALELKAKYSTQIKAQ